MFLKTYNVTYFSKKIENISVSTGGAAPQTPRILAGGQSPPRPCTGEPIQFYKPSVMKVEIVDLLPKSFRV